MSIHRNWLIVRRYLIRLIFRYKGCVPTKMSKCYPRNPNGWPIYISLIFFWTIGSLVKNIWLTVIYLMINKIGGLDIKATTVDIIQNRYIFFHIMTNDAYDIQLWQKSIWPIFVSKKSNFLISIWWINCIQI